MTQVRAGREIHRGGMASIHEAIVEGLGGLARKVALKRIVNPTPEAIERFSDEIRVLSQLSHPGIVHLLGAGEEDGLPYLLLELVDGLDLARITGRARQRMSEDVALFIVREIAWTLAHVHRATDEEGAPLGIVHRDVSCENIMIGWDGTVRLIDFGIAASSDKKSRTAVGRPLGKRKYMAPELDDGGCDPRSDLFALGRVLHELAGEEASNTTRAIIERACDPDPQRRHASAEHFAADCGSALASIGGVDPRPRLIEWLAPLRQRRVEKGNDLIDPFLAPPEPRPSTRVEVELAEEPTETLPKVAGHALLKELGRGVTGSVYLAHHAGRGERCAIKILHAGIRPIVGARLFREARSLIPIDHPNIVRIFDCGTTENGHPYLRMELIEGKTLRQSMREGALDLTAKIDIMIQIAEGLSAAHERGIVHRDLKPDNVFVLGAGDALQVKLVDFGISRVVHDETLTNTGDLLGTPGYMAPEQVMEARVGPRADIYSLGVIGYELVAGRRPFSGQLGEVLLQHVEKPPPMLPENPLSPLVMAMLAKDPEQRPTVEQIIRDLNSIAGRSATAVKDTSDQQKTKQMMRTDRRPYWYGAIAASLAAAIFVLLREKRVEPVAPAPRVEQASGPTAIAIEKRESGEAPLEVAAPIVEAVAPPRKSPPKFDPAPWTDRFAAALRSSRLERDEIDVELVRRFDAGLSRRDEREMNAVIEEIARLAPTASALVGDLAEAKRAMRPEQEAEYLDLREAIDRARSAEARRSLRDRIRAFKDSAGRPR